MKASPAQKDRAKMPEQPPADRVRNFDEVALGLGLQEAMIEADRCLQCANPLCVQGCPVEVDIKSFLKLIKEGDVRGAVEKIREKNSLPAICGRVCPQEEQCEKLCVLSKRHRPVAIGWLERFAADYAANSPAPAAKPVGNGRRVAVVGSGPAGLTAASELALLGYDATIFEALHAPGGVLTYGIPEFRLPKRIVKSEVSYVQSLGVKIELDVVVGRTATVDELFAEGFEAVFLGTGAGLPKMLNVPGENLGGVYYANEFLTRVNLMKAYKFPDSANTPVKIGSRVLVVGGGDVAMDSARTAKRLGAEKVAIVYRRTLEEIPARRDEVKHAQEEGIEFLTLAAPVRLDGDEKGWVRRMVCVKMRLGEPDPDGRRSVTPIEGSEFTLETDLVIVAVGVGVNPLAPKSTAGLKMEHGHVVANPETGQTTREGVFAGGDVVTGAATVIEAMGAGKRAARAIHQYLSQKKVVARTPA